MFFNFKNSNRNEKDTPVLESPVKEKEVEKEPLIKEKSSNGEKIIVKEKIESGNVTLA